LLFLALAPVAAQAQIPLPDYSWLGAGVRSGPAYDGPPPTRTELIPSVRYYGRPWFARTTQGMLEGGARIEITTDLHLGAQFAYEGGRIASEAVFLASRNVRTSSRALPPASMPNGISGSDRCRSRSWPARASSSTPTGGRRPICALPRSSTAAARSPCLSSSRGPGRSAKSNQSFYGVTPEVSASTGLPQYTPGSGLLFTTGGVLWGVDLSRSWIVVGNLEARRLHGDAAGSPLVEQPPAATRA